MKKLISICLSVILVLGLAPTIIATATNTVTVGTTGTTLIEAEDYTTAKGTIQQTESDEAVDATITHEVKDDASASGEKYLYASNYSTSAYDRTLYWEYGFEIEEAGTYKVKTRVGKPWRYRFHGLTVTFGETTMAEITSWSETTTGDAVEWGEYEEELTLAAGTYTFKVETDEGTGGNHQLFVDYVSVTPVSIGTDDDNDEPIAPSENSAVTIEENGTKIEAEDHTTVTNHLETTIISTGETTESDVLFTAPTETQEDSATVLKYNYTNANTETESYYQEVIWKVPIVISTEGSYEIEYRINQSGNYHGNIFAVLDGTELAQTEGVGSGTPVLTTYKSAQTLTAGTHYVSVVAKRAWNLNCTLVVDYVSVTPSAEAPEPEVSTVSVSATGETVIEAEDYLTTYVNDNGAITSYDAVEKDDVPTASGGKYLYNNKGAAIVDAEHYWEINLEITTAGVYEITSIIPVLTRYRFHSIKITVGGNEFYSESSGQPSYSSDIPEFREETVQQYLEAGVHSYRFYAGKGTGGNQMLFFDAVKLELVKEDHIPPVASNVILTETTPGWVGGEVTVTYSYSSSTAEKGSKLQILEKDGEEWVLLAEEVINGGSGSIDITDEMANKEIKGIFFAVDEFGAKTEATEISLQIPRREFYVGCSFDENTSYKADVQVDFFKDGTEDLLIILALYDKTGAMVDYQTEQLNITAQNVYNVSIEKTHADAASASLFVWSGTSIEGANDIAYIDKQSR